MQQSTISWSNEVKALIENYEYALASNKIKAHVFDLIEKKEYATLVSDINGLNLSTVKHYMLSDIHSIIAGHVKEYPDFSILMESIETIITPVAPV